MLPNRAYVFMALNAIRAISIIALLLAFSSSIFVIVTDIRAVNTYTLASPSSPLKKTNPNPDYIPNSTVPAQAAGVFWAVLNRLLILIQVVILLLSEVAWPIRFFDRFFPVLGSEFGLGPIGIFQCLLGAAILSHHTDDFTLVAAFFLFSVGCVNMLAGLIWREKAKAKRCIFTWKNEGKAKAFPEYNGDKKRPFSPLPAPTFLAQHGGKGDEEMGYGWTSEKSPDSEYETWRRSPSSLGFGKAGEKAAGLKGFLLARPVEALPRYASPTPAYSSPAHSSPGRPPSLSLSVASSAESSRPGTPESGHGSRGGSPRFKSSDQAI